jgi:ArsR family transcriptional regulator
MILQQTEAAASTALLTAQLKALGDETRLSLIQQVAASSCHNGACICDLTPTTQLAQSTVSHHMKILVDAGLITRRQDGKWAFYELTAEGSALLEALKLAPSRVAGCGDCAT